MKLISAIVFGILLMLMIDLAYATDIVIYKESRELEEKVRERSAIAKRDGLLGPLTSIVNAVLALLGIGGALGGGGLLDGVLDGLINGLGLGGLVGTGSGGLVQSLLKTVTQLLQNLTGGSQTSSGLLGGLLGTGSDGNGLLGGLLGSNGGASSTGLLGGLLGGGGGATTNTGLLGSVLGLVQNLLGSGAAATSNVNVNNGLLGVLG